MPQKVVIENNSAVLLIQLLKCNRVLEVNIIYLSLYVATGGQLWKINK